MFGGLPVPGGTTHFNDEDGLLYVTKGGLFVKQHNETPLYVDHVVQISGAVIADKKMSRGGHPSGPVDELRLRLMS